MYSIVIQNDPTPLHTPTPPNRLDIFVRGANSALYHKYRDGSTWSPSWTSIGGTLVNDPVAVSCLPDRVDVFAIGTDSSLYSKTWDGTQWLPRPLEFYRHGGEWKATPSVVSRSPGTMDVFLLGYDLAIWHQAYTTERGWGPFKSLGGAFRFAPSALTRGPNDLHVFAVGFDSVYTISQKGPASLGFGEWKKLGGIVISEVKAVSWGPNRIDLFGIGTDSALWHKWCTDGDRWGPSAVKWEWMNGRFQGVPEAFCRTQDRVHVLVRDTSSVVQEKWFRAGNWWPNSIMGDFHPSGGTLGGTAVHHVSVLCVGNHVDCFAVNFDQEVIHKAWLEGWEPSTAEYESLGSVLALSNVAATYRANALTSTPEH